MGKPSRHTYYTDEHGITWAEWQQLKDGSWYRRGWDAQGQEVQDIQPVDRSVPRSSNTIDHLTSGLQALSVAPGDPHPDPNAYSHVNPQVHQGFDHGGGSTQARPSRREGKRKDKGADPYSTTAEDPYVAYGSGSATQPEIYSTSSNLQSDEHVRSSKSEGRRKEKGTEVYVAEETYVPYGSGSATQPEVYSTSSNLPSGEHVRSSKSEGKRKEKGTEVYVAEETYVSYDTGAVSESAPYPTSNPLGGRSSKPSKSEGKRKEKGAEHYLPVEEPQYEPVSNAPVSYQDPYGTGNSMSYTSNLGAGLSYSTHPTTSVYPETGYAEDDPGMTAALAASSKLYHSQSYSQSYLGESSAATSQAYAPLVDEDRVPTPTAASAYKVPKAPKSHATGSIRTYDWFDDRFRVEPTSRFEYGEVFKVLWSEPLGQSKQTPDMPPMTEYRETQEANGELFYTGIRRFIVIGTDGGNSICVPILTYGRQGCKKGAKPEKHGIVYQPPNKAQPMPNEPRLGMPPVRLEMYAEGEKLARESRVNYSKHVTIEHNWKVLFIGRIHPDDHDLVEDSVNQCWEQRKRTRHERRKHHHDHHRTR